MLAIGVQLTETERVDIVQIKSYIYIYILIEIIVSCAQKTYTQYTWTQYKKIPSACVSERIVRCGEAREIENCDVWWPTQRGRERKRDNMLNMVNKVKFQSSAGIATAFITRNPRKMHLATVPTSVTMYTATPNPEDRWFDGVIGINFEIDHVCLIVWIQATMYVRMWIVL